MNTVTRRSLSIRTAGLCFGTILTALLLVPRASQAQIDTTAVGYEALAHNTTGSYNTATGYYALNSNTTGVQNTANGSGALASNTTGDYNTAIGINALMFNSTGSGNTAIGNIALYSNTTGYQNTASGGNALYFNTVGYENTAYGNYALYFNTAGYENTAYGNGALYGNTTGHGNLANGVVGLYSNTTGYQNTSNGNNAMYHNTTGFQNAAYGNYALFGNTTGSNNIGLGYEGGQGITTGSDNIDIGNEGASTDSSIIRIGTKGNQTETFIAGISGVTTTNGVEVFINSNGQLGTVKSSRRFKFDIKDLGATSSKLMDLRPVTFRYKEAAENGTHPVQYGLIAEEVAKIYPDLVQYDKQGKPFTVYYHLLTPLMLNELQKAHQEIITLKAGLAQTAAVQTQVGLLNNQVQAQSSQMAALQHSNQVMYMGFIGLILVAGALLLAARASVSQKRGLSVLQTKAVETFCS